MYLSIIYTLYIYLSYLYVSTHNVHTAFHSHTRTLIYRYLSIIYILDMYLSYIYAFIHNVHTAFHSHTDTFSKFEMQPHWHFSKFWGLTLLRAATLTLFQNLKKCQCGCISSKCSTMRILFRSNFIHVSFSRLIHMYLFILHNTFPLAFRRDPCGNFFVPKFLVRQLPDDHMVVWKSWKSWIVSSTSLISSAS